MLTKEQAEEILHALKRLPPEKVCEVHDYVLFLTGRYGTEDLEGYCESWSAEDLLDLSVAVWKYAEQTVPWEEKSETPLE